MNFRLLNQNHAARAEAKPEWWQSSQPAKPVFAKFKALANVFNSPKPHVRLECEEGREEWAELHEVHPVLNDQMPSLSPFKW